MIQTIWRVLAAIAGLGVIGAATHLNIVHAGGYGSGDAGLIVTVAVLVAIGMGYAAMVWRDGSNVRAIGLTLCLVAGEAYWTATNVERELQARGAAEAPLARARAGRAQLVREVKEAEATKKAADAAAQLQATLPGCRKNCAHLLTDTKREADSDLAAKQAALNALQTEKITDALADHLGLSHWAYDLIIAGLRSLAVMGGSLAIALAVHSAAAKPPIAVPEILPPAPPLGVPVIAGPTGDVKRFLLACLPRAKGEEVTASAVYARYQRWCDNQGQSAIKPREFAEKFKAVAERVGIRVRRDGAKIYCRDVRLVA
jgi:hypothetical protein